MDESQTLSVPFDQVSLFCFSVVKSGSDNWVNKFPPLFLLIDLAQCPFHFSIQQGLTFSSLFSKSMKKIRLDTVPVPQVKTHACNWSYIHLVNTDGNDLHIKINNNSMQIQCSRFVFNIKLKSGTNTAHMWYDGWWLILTLCPD